MLFFPCLFTLKLHNPVVIGTALPYVARTVHEHLHTFTKARHWRPSGGAFGRLRSSRLNVRTHACTVGVLRLVNLRACREFYDPQPLQCYSPEFWAWVVPLRGGASKRSWPRRKELPPTFLSSEEWAVCAQPAALILRFANESMSTLAVHKVYLYT
jgi:hypothetical protein